MIDLKEIKLNILDRVYALAVDKLVTSAGPRQRIESGNLTLLIDSGFSVYIDV